MIDLTDAVALAGIALAAYAGCLGLIGAAKGTSFTPHYALVLLTFLALFVLLVPLQNSLSLAGFIRGMSSDLSTTLVALSGWSVCHRFGLAKPVDDWEFGVLMLALVCGALFLYPAALGWGDWDGYRLGWGSWWFLAALLGVCMAGAGLGLRVLPALIAVAVLAWSFGWMASSNLWDYLLDPWLSAYALVFVFIKCWLSAIRRLANRSAH